MSNNLPETQNDPQGPNAQDPTRRRLLRAAASAAPLIATLPSGAALANGSGAQGVVEAKKLNAGLPGADGGPAEDGGEYKIPTATADRWVRYQAYRVVWIEIAPQPQTAPKKIPTYRFSTDEATGPWYLENGLQFLQNSPPEFQQESNTLVNVLALYKPTPDGAAPDSVMDACISPSAGDPAIPKNVCVFPFARLQRSTLDGNMAISQSVLASFV